jgi:small subunit ribosomal protein S6
MKRPYEAMVVFDGTQPDDILQKEQKQFEELISQHAEFEKTDVWGKKSLAYPIRKKRTGYYCLFLYSGSGDLNPVIDKYVKLNDMILRHLVVVRDLKNEAARLEVAQRKERAPIDEPIINERESGGRNYNRDRD